MHPFHFQNLTMQKIEAARKARAAQRAEKGK